MTLRTLLPPPGQRASSSCRSAGGWRSILSTSFRALEQRLVKAADKPGVAVGHDEARTAMRLACVHSVQLGNVLGGRGIGSRHGLLAAAIDDHEQRVVAGSSAR